MGYTAFPLEKPDSILHTIERRASKISSPTYDKYLLVCVSYASCFCIAFNCTGHVATTVARQLIYILAPRWDWVAIINCFGNLMCFSTFIWSFLISEVMWYYDCNWSVISHFYCWVLVVWPWYNLPTSHWIDWTPENMGIIKKSFRDVLISKA